MSAEGEHIIKNLISDSSADPVTSNLLTELGPEFAVGPDGQQQHVANHFVLAANFHPRDADAEIDSVFLKYAQRYRNYYFAEQLFKRPASSPGSILPAVCRWKSSASIRRR